MPQVQLPSLPGGWTTDTLQISDTTFRFSSPSHPDLLLDDPVVQEANDRDDYMPYWAFTWQSSTLLAEAILRQEWTAGTSALEIGCGLGLTGLAALARGLDVTFSDYEPAAVEASLYNARQNGFSASGLVLDWRTPVEERYLFIFAADVLYEERHHEPILKLLDTMLPSGGTAWFGDPGRRSSLKFCALACRRGYRLNYENQHGEVLPDLTVGEFGIIKLSAPGK